MNWKNLYAMAVARKKALVFRDNMSKLYAAQDQGLHMHQENEGGLICWFIPQTLAHNAEQDKVTKKFTSC